MRSAQDLLDPGFLRKLDRLRFTVRVSLTTRSGNTPMPHGSQPSGLELAQYKAYAPGDDLRHLDWNAYGRLDEMLIKIFRAEREAPLHILIDTSASMGAPAEDRKLPFAAVLAVALAYIALRHQDPVRIVAVGDSTAGARASPLFSHPSRLGEIHSFLSALRTGGSVGLDEAVRSYLSSTRSAGIAVVLSDFLLEPARYQEALGQLQARGFGPAAIRVLGPEERQGPRLSQRVRLRDSETGQLRTVTLTRRHREAYAASVQTHVDSLRRWCAARGIPLAVVDPSDGAEQCVFGALTDAGLLH